MTSGTPKTYMPTDVKLTLYGGTGIIGSYYRGMYASQYVDRDHYCPLTEDVLYLISTTDNTNIYTSPQLDIHTNLSVLANRLDHCRDFGINTFNFVSSWFVYGPTHVKPTERSICNPNGFYSVTKYAAEKLVMEYCQAHGMNWRIFRLGNVYGGPDKGTEKRNALHRIIQFLREDKEVDVYQGLSRDYIHIQDVCRAMNFLCNKGGLNQIYNIGTGIETPLFDCVADAKDILKSRSKIQRITPSEDYNQAIRFSLDCTKLHNLGFQPMLTLQEGLEDLCRDQKFCTPVRTLTVVR
jgi:nucleoside-diphosphate-sugar epimerase